VRESRLDKAKDIPKNRAITNEGAETTPLFNNNIMENATPDIQITANHSI
jgi:hypothetical protein